MFLEVSAFVFEFDAYTLPLARTDLTLRFAVRESNLDHLDQVAQLVGDHSKEEYYPVLVDRCVAEATEINRVSVGWPVRQNLMASRRRAPGGRRDRALGS